MSDINITIASSNEEEKTKTYECLSICCTFVLLISLLGCLIAYFILVILGLVETSNQTITYSCPDSQLWLFSLLTLILGSSISSCAIKITKNLEGCEKLLGFICNTVILSFFTGWGVKEIFNPCIVYNFSNTLLYHMGKTQFLLFAITLVSYVIISLILVSSFIYDKCKKNR